MSDAREAIAAVVGMLMASDDDWTDEDCADAILSALSAMPLASRVALARELVPEMVELLSDLADDLEAETENRFGFPGETSPYHSENIRKRRDLEPVRRARAMLTAAEEPPHGP